MLASYQKRVVAEKANLDELLGKLLGFIQTSAFAELPPEEQVRLREQSGFMSAYSDVLGRRIAAFNLDTGQQPEIPLAVIEEYEQGAGEIRSRIK